MEPVGLDFRVAGKNGEECTGVGVDRFAAVHYGMREGGNVDRFFVGRAERFAVAAMGMEMAFFLSLRQDFAEGRHGGRSFACQDEQGRFHLWSIHS